MRPGALRRPAVAVAILLSLCLLAGCGRPGKPLPVREGTYPRIYPDPKLIPGAGAQARPSGQAAPQPAQPTTAKPDSSVESMRYYTPVLPGSNLPNSATTQGGSPMDQSIGPQGPSPLALPPAFPAEEDQGQPQ